MRGRTAAWLLPALVFALLHARALDYGFVWVDEAEIAAGTILRPPGRILRAFGEPLQQVADFAARPYSQPYYRPLQVVVAEGIGQVAHVKFVAHEGTPQKDSGGAMQSDSREQQSKET